MKAPKKRPRFTMMETGEVSVKALMKMEQHKKYFLKYYTKQQMEEFRVNSDKYPHITSIRKQKSAEAQAATVRRNNIHQSLLDENSSLRQSVNNSLVLNNEIKKLFGQGMKHGYSTMGLIADAYVLINAYQTHKEALNAEGIGDSDIKIIEDFIPKLLKAVERQH